ncbi:MAG: proline--tRNA ligase [Anaerolineae bacterium UTCFX2]|jgi:prolyl-tRNA synthetase|nr:proline--tRNA ligase [Anaerolineales bacterium]OQY94673.1 MAG: proline--tRNA ligase [Anaerolineae bacterium UTCFX2]
MSNLFGQTLRDIPSEAEVTSHQLLLRAGFIRQLAAGIFSYLPLARRSLAKIEAIAREEMESIGGQEINMPVVHPADLWKETGRWYEIDAEMSRFKDRNDREMVLAMTHEEVVADLVRQEIRSYRQLPRLVFQIQTKWRDDPRPRAGLIRAREFSMKDSYSLDADWEGLDRQYQAHFEAYHRIFQRCGLPVIAVSADVGMMGGKAAHEFMTLTSVGEDTILICDACGYKANRQIAAYKKSVPDREVLLPIEKVATPDTKTIEDLANYLAVSKARTAKAVFLIASIAERSEVHEQFVFAIVRGDREVNEYKLANAIKARSLRPATEEEIRNTGAVPGYASPIGLSGVFVVVDDQVADSPNLVAGANVEGYHLKNVNYPRDYQADLVADITTAQSDDGCPQCASSLKAVRGVEVGNIFKLGAWYSEAMGCHYLDTQGQSKPVIMGSYGIGLGRLLGCLAEIHYDEHGLIWPVSVAPFQVHLVVLVGKGDSESLDVAERLYNQLQQASIEALYDDRQESPGVKFNDADLIGIPIRLTVSARARQAGGIEFKRRDQAEKQIVADDEVIAFVQKTLRLLYQELEAGRASEAQT